MGQVCFQSFPKIILEKQIEISQIALLEQSNAPLCRVFADPVTFLQSYCNSHISRRSDGTYCAGFPWKAEHPPLPNNFEVCQKCTRSLAYRLVKSPGLLQSYDKILTEQLARGFIEPVTECNKGDAAVP